MAHAELGPHDALILVDVQNDFCPGGALPIEEGDHVVPVLNRWIEKARASGATIVASCDWHPPDHVSFTPHGGPWPVHCVQETEGAALHRDLDLPGDATIVKKGTARDKDSYSALDETGLAETLRERDVRRLWVGGLALDVCVRATVLDALQEGFEVHVLPSATRPVDAAAGEQALNEMERAGAVIERGE